MLELGILIYGLIASVLVSVFAGISVRELRRLGRESEAAAQAEGR